jgi:NADPH2:quinone reductase
MKAWLVRELGGPQAMRLEEVPEPAPMEGLVRIRVAAAAVNFFDSLQLAGLYQIKPELPFVPGGEVAGTVLEAPRDSGVQPGDRVLAMVQQGIGLGGYTPITHAAATTVIRIPEAMPFDEAAAFFVNYQTGWFGLHRRAALREGETLLVHAGAGGVGSAAIQLGKAAGARVIATAGSPEKVAVCTDLGADHAIDYKTEDFADSVERLTDGRGADVVYDPVGGDVFDRSTKCIAWEGRIVVVGFTSGRIPALRANHVLIKNYSVVGLHWGVYNQRDPGLVDACTRELFDLYDAGKIKPYVSRRLPLEEAAQALADVAAGKTTGKVVLLPDGSAG